MTCRKADELMENVLDGEADDESTDRLKEHLGACERCADAWHAIWQVRSLLAQCETPDPGEVYFERATAAIMGRVSAMQEHKTPADEPPIISSMRYGPLPVRGVGAAFVFALGVLVGSFLSAPGEARCNLGSGARDVGWVPARALHPSPGGVLMGQPAVHHRDAARAVDRCQRNVELGMASRKNLSNLVGNRECFVCWQTPPPMIPTSQLAMSR
jgi:anti-sigma factor RsiW